MTGSLSHRGKGGEGGARTLRWTVSGRGWMLYQAALTRWGLTLRGRWISQLHKECRDRRNGSQLGFRLFFTTLERHGELVTANLSSRILPFLLPSPQPQAPTSVLQTSWSLWSPLVL